MLPYNYLCLTKLLAYSSGDQRIQLSKVELEVATELLKQMYENNPCLNDAQKDYFKFLIDLAKQMTSTRD